MVRKRKTFPDDFWPVLRQGDVDSIVAVFDTCEIDARGGNTKSTLLGFRECTAELARWLVANGADVNARDAYQSTALHLWARQSRADLGVLVELGGDIEAVDLDGETPLHAAARAHSVTAASALIAAGANVGAAGRRRATPIDSSLASVDNLDLPTAPDIVEFLLASGAQVSPSVRASVKRIGTEFEFHRSGLNPERVGRLAPALRRLYELTGVAPVAPVLKHDLTSPIAVTATEWGAQHNELWDLLVPSSGTAATVQGEVIRVSGRIGNELLNNGGVNWDADFTRMLTALAAALASHTSLDSASRGRVTEAVEALGGGAVIQQHIDTLCELSVRWVLANPQPIELGPVDYRR